MEVEPVEPHIYISNDFIKIHPKEKAIQKRNFDEKLAGCVSTLVDKIISRYSGYIKPTDDIKCYSVYMAQFRFDNTERTLYINTYMDVPQILHLDDEPPSVDEEIRNTLLAATEYTFKKHKNFLDDLSIWVRGSLMIPKSKIKKSLNKILQETMKI